MIKIIVVGKKTEYDFKINEYETRLKNNFKISWTKIDYSGAKGELAREQESKEILSKISKNDFVILLDERGKELDNQQLTNKLTTNKNIVIIIGGPYGVNEELRKRANYMWSLGKLIMPYEIVRLLLTEQIYRCQCISTNHPYHHI
ncbi:MAG: 23S rRNA (pseudouridine(1915)-N(3))-methyltransferase RlmH [Mycoplasmataceae bacterium]|jgi:23S rRNA (pseudouridine1915-N3)-methyltransferase|nr:23S rRNA (pseudouridine(1915)-N(3))-methyltransferase RlmH [Mycoplasmataceae bacterium]